MGWKPAQDVTAMDIFKIQDVNLVQSAEVLGLSKRKLNRTRRSSLEINGSKNENHGLIHSGFAAQYFRGYQEIEHS